MLKTICAFALIFVITANNAAQGACVFLKDAHGRACMLKGAEECPHSVNTPISCAIEGKGVQPHHEASQDSCNMVIKCAHDEQFTSSAISKTVYLISENPALVPPSFISHDRAALDIYIPAGVRNDPEKPPQHPFLRS